MERWYRIISYIDSYNLYTFNYVSIMYYFIYKFKCFIMTEFPQNKMAWIKGFLQILSNIRMNTTQKNIENII
jgi:hypothetical protein